MLKLDNWVSPMCLALLQHPSEGTLSPPYSPFYRGSNPRLREVMSLAQGHRAEWGLHVERSSPPKAMHIQKQRPWCPQIPGLTIALEAHPSEGNSKSYIPSYSQNPLLSSVNVWPPQASTPPLFFEATGCSPHAPQCYGRDLPIVQPTVVYYQAPLAGLGPLETNEPWSLTSVQQSKAFLIHFTGEKNSSRDENRLVGTEVGSLPCFETGQQWFPYFRQTSGPKQC